jgi:UDP-glucose 4-epimerase
MKSVILGGSGFLGQRLTQSLCARGQQVLTISRSPLAAVGPSHRHRDITLDDRRTLAPLLEDADFVFHLASDTTPGVSRLQPALEVSNNLLPLAGLLECLQALSKPTLVYISSGGAIYDNTGEILSENSPKSPASYYGAGKLAAEALIQAYQRQTGYRAVILRPANVFGPGQIPKKQFGIVPTLCDCLLNEIPFTLWGDGSAVRDYLYIDDFLLLCQKIVEHPWPNPMLEILNAGTGEGHSILSLCKLLEQVSGRTLKIETMPPRGVDAQSVVLDSARAQAVLGWQAETDLETGLRETWRWFSRRGG